MRSANDQSPRCRECRSSSCTGVPHVTDTSTGRAHLPGEDWSRHQRASGTGENGSGGHRQARTDKAAFVWFTCAGVTSGRKPRLALAAAGLGLVTGAYGLTAVAAQPTRQGAGSASLWWLMHTHGRRQTSDGDHGYRLRPPVRATPLPTTTRATADLGDDTNPLEAEFDLPGADLSGEDLTIRVLPAELDEFTWTSCYLVQHRSQLAEQGRGVCLECTA